MAKRKQGGAAFEVSVESLGRTAAAAREALAAHGPDCRGCVACSAWGAAGTLRACSAALRVLAMPFDEMMREAEESRMWAEYEAERRAEK